MNDALYAWLQAHSYLVLIAAGALVLVGAIFDWKWITRITSPSTLAGLRAWIEGLYGERARFAFERFLMGGVGILLILLGIAYAALDA